MSYGTYQNPTQLVAPYLSNGFRSTFTSGQKSRKMNRSQDHPKGDFVLDGIKMAVSDGNRLMLKTRIEKVEHYREHNSFTTKLNNGAHRPRKKQLRKVPKTHHQQVNASFYVLREDESMIRKFLTKMRDKEEEVASNIQRIVDEEYDSLDRRSGKRYQKIFHDVHKRIAPERPGIKHFNYLDPETMVKLDKANVNHRKSPTGRDGAADSLSEFPPVPAHYEDWEKPEPALPILKPNGRLRSHRPRLSVIDEAEEKKARGIIRVYANRSCSPHNGSTFLKEERQKIKTATNYQRGAGGDSASMTGSDFAKTAYSSARDGFMRPTRRRIESMDGRVQVKIESEDAQRAARRAFLTKNSSKNTRADNYYPVENEYWSAGDSFVALMRAQERIDHSCGMLRSQIHKSRDESAYHKRSISDFERPPENTANLRILNVKHSNGALDISPTNQPLEGYEPIEKKRKKKSQEEILPTESISGGAYAEEGNTKYFDLLNVQHGDIKDLDLKKISDYIENIDLNQSPRGAQRTSAKDFHKQNDKEKEPLSDIRGLEEKMISDHLNFENITSSGLRSPEEGWKESRNSSREPRKRSDSSYKSRAPTKIKAPRNNITDVIGVGRLDSVSEDVSSSKRVTSGTGGGESRKLETRKSEESNKSGGDVRSGNSGKRF